MGDYLTRELVDLEELRRGSELLNWWSRSIIQEWRGLEGYL